MGSPYVSPTSQVASSLNYSAAPAGSVSGAAKSEVSDEARQTVADSGNALPQTAPESDVSASVEAVIEAAAKISDRVENTGRKLQFSVSEGSGRVVITVLDKVSDEVIRQIPGEQALALAEHLESLADDAPVLGLLLNSEA